MGTSAAPMFDVLFFDLDGVVRRWDNQDTAAIEARHGLPAGAMAEAAFEPSLVERAITGRIPDETWRLAIRNSLARVHGEVAAAAEAEWSEPSGRADDEVLTLIAEVRERFRPRLGLITNATTRLEADLRRLKLEQTFDVVINSARIGFAKPDERIYRAACHRAGYPPQRCLFIDDTPGHVDAAIAFGMHALLFAGVPALREALAALLDR